MFFFSIFLVELFLLFLLSRRVTIELSRLFYNITSSKKLSIILLAIIFSPGTLIHELSHLLASKILLVPTGRLALLPKIEGDSVKLGSLEIVKKDPLRLFLIGIAPFIAGTTLLLSVIALSIEYDLQQNIQLLAILVYIIFVIGNTMFSSKKDLEDAWILLIPAGVIVLFLYLFKVPVKLPDLDNEFAYYTSLMKTSSLLLIIPTCLDIIVIIISKTLNALFRRGSAGFSS